MSNTIGAAIVGTLVYWVITIVDPLLLSWQCLNRPIVVAPLTGLLLGDLGTGLVMGAALESIFMGISAIGGSIPADGLSASIIAVVYTITTGSNYEVGLAIALPIGTAMSSFSGILTPFSASLAAYWENLAVNGKPRSFVVQNMLVGFFVLYLPQVIAMFFGLAFGVQELNNLLAALPSFVMRGLGAASGMMLAVGFAILTSMIWSGRVGCFFFVGYVLSKVVGLDSLSIAILGAAIAITMFFSDKRFTDLKASLQSAGASSKQDEEAFF